MNDRQRFQAIMHYGRFDRGIIQDFQYWEETIDAWHMYGLPREVDYAGCEEFFGFDRFWDDVGAEVGLCPAFEQKVLKDEGQTVVIQEADGTITRRHKRMSSIPQHLSHTLVDRDSWERHYKWRLDPANPDRIGADIAEKLAANADATRTWPLHTWCGSMFGVLRNWMGLEGVCYIQYDDPKLFAEMVQTIGDCVVGTLERFLPMAAAAGVRLHRTPVGEANVAARMVQAGCIFGGEGNGGVMDPRVVIVRDSFVGIGLMLNYLAASGKSVSELVSHLPRYEMHKEKFPCPQEAAADILQAVRDVLGAREAAKVNEEDGLRVDLPDRSGQGAGGWVHVRASNTEPIMRITAEAPTRAQAEALAREVREIADRLLRG